MKTAYMDQTGFGFEDLELPVLAPSEVLVKTIGCGICGGDQHLFRVKDKVAADKPLWLGHEGTGVVVAKGSDVEAYDVGQVVTSLSGGFSDHFVAKTSDIMQVPRGVDPLMALGEPVACCVHACDRTKPLPTDRVAVIGCGFMGLLCLQILKAEGAQHITAVDPVAYRREMALALGADAAVTPDVFGDVDPDVGQFDLVLEAAGNQPALDLATDLVTHHGRVNLVGYHESNEGQRSVNMQRWNYKAIEVVNGHVRRDGEKHRAMEKGVAMIAEGRIQTEPLVSVYPLSKIQDAFDDLVGAKKQLFKIVLVPDEA